MEKPNFEEILSELEEESENLRKNSVHIVDKGIIAAFKRMIQAMAWSSEQQDTNNIQVANLTEEIKSFRKDLEKYSTSASKESNEMRNLTYLLGIVALLQLGIAFGQYKLGEQQVSWAHSQASLQEAIWQYEMSRNNRIEARDIEWRREDLEAEGRLPRYN